MTFKRLKDAIKDGERALEEAEVGSQAVAYIEAKHLRELLAAVRAHYGNIMIKVGENASAVFSNMLDGILKEED